MVLLTEMGGGRFLSEAMPTLFTEPGMSEVEKLLWVMHYQDRKNQLNG